MTIKEDWLRVHHCFDPLVPAGDSEHRDMQRVERPYSPLGAINEALEFPAGFRRELIVGAKGSGKTTELMALIGRARGFRPLLVDVHGHFDNQRGDATALDRLQPWEVLVVIALAVYRYGPEVLGHTWSQDLSNQLAGAIGSLTDTAVGTVADANVNLPGLATDIAITVVEDLVPGSRLAVRALKALGDNVSARLPLGTQNRRAQAQLDEQDSSVKQLLDASNRMLTELNVEFHAPILLLVDGVDREKDGALSRRLFEESTLFARLLCHQVLTADVSLLRVRNVRGGWTPRFLGNVPVLAPESPLEPAARCDFFVELWNRRALDAEFSVDLMQPALVRRLAWASGGSIRDFSEMVRDIARLGWSQECPADLAHIDQVVDEWRRRWEHGLNSAELTTLREVLQSRRLPGDEIDQRLLALRCIVAWPNETVWYFPHPLLLLRMLSSPAHG